MGHVPMSSPVEDLRAVRRPVAARAARPVRLRAPGRERGADRRPVAHRPRPRWTSSPSGRTGWPPRRSPRRPVRPRDGPARAGRRDPPGQRPGRSGRAPTWRPWPSSSPSSASETGGSPRAARRPISDGAAGGAARLARRPRGGYGLRPRARILDQTTVGVDPIIMLTGPIPATRKLLDRNRMTHRRHRPVRGQRGVQLGGAGLGTRAEARHGPGQRQRRRHRARPPGGRHRRPAVRPPCWPSWNAATPRSGLVTMCCGGGLGTATLIQRIDA